MSLFFSRCQTFFLDASLVDGASEVAITKVDLYFRAKPAATGNKSGIERPGVEVMILPCRNGLPVISQIGAYRPTEPTEHGAKFAFYSGGQVARVEYDEIRASVDASVPTEFLLESPAFVRTNQEYAIVIKFDGNESFRLWEATIGEWILRTNTVFPGPSGRFIGNLFNFVQSGTSLQNSGYGYTNNAVVPSTAGNPALMHTSTQNLGIDGSDNAELSGVWSHVPNADLKFKVAVARYSHKGFPVVANAQITSNTLITSAVDRAYNFNLPDGVISNNVIRLIAPCETQEYIRFDRSNSIRNELMYGETIFQLGPQLPGGAVVPLKVTCGPTGNINGIVNVSGVSNLVEFKQTLVIANSNYVFANGRTLNQIGGLRSLFDEGTPIVFRSANGDSHSIRYVSEFRANNVMVVDSPFVEPMSNATMSISPIGFINDISPAYLHGMNKDMMILYDSTANSSVRFVSNALDTITIEVGGSGYSNSDYLWVGGYENINAAVQGNYPARANLVTNSTGGITAVYPSNSGAGFVDLAWLTGANVQIRTSANGIASNSASSGSGATFSFEVGSKLASEFSGSIFANAEVMNLDAVRMKPEITVNNPVGTAFTVKHRTLFYKTPDDRVQSGFATYVNTPSEQAATDTYAKIFKSHTLQTTDDRIPVVPSRSNQFVTRYANGIPVTTDIIGDVYSNAAMFVFDISSNNDFQATYFDPEIVNSHYSNYIINRDYTDEHTNYGKAWARHISNKIHMKEDRFAEDLLVYVTAYRPAGSDLKVYAKIHNSNDPEEFDDKDWTLLDLIEGQGLYSSKDDSSDFVDLTYNLPSYPNSEFTLIGSAMVQSGNATVTGTNTQFAARFNVIAGGTGFTNGDLIVVEPPVEAVPQTGIFALGPKRNAQGVITTNTSGGISSVLVVDSGKGFIDQSNVGISSISFANSTGGSINATANVSYRPGLIPNDVVKIYSPYFPETNYTVSVIETVTDANFTIRRTFGDLSSNGVGTVAVNTTSTGIVGTGTSFLTDFTPGDFVAVWSNTTAYEIRQVETVANNVRMDIVGGSNFTFDNSGRAYAYVENDSFVNNSIAVSDLKVDKLYYENQAYNNIQQDNVSRYFSLSKGVYDGFDTFQVKVVMVSNNDYVIPKIDNVQGVAVTA